LTAAAAGSYFSGAFLGSVLIPLLTITCMQFFLPLVLGSVQYLEGKFYADWKVLRKCVLRCSSLFLEKGKEDSFWSAHVRGLANSFGDQQSCSKVCQEQ
jgi:hypothetical protein